MGLFDLPTGNFELKLKPKSNDCYYKEEGWQSVMMTDRLDYEMVVGIVEDHEKDYEVHGARYNGKPIKVPNKYHWELRHKDEVFGSFKTRAEAVALMQQRKAMRRKDKNIKVGLPKFVLD